MSATYVIVGLFIASLFLYVAFRELFYLLMRMRKRWKRKDRHKLLVGVNPHRFRPVLYQTTGHRLRRLSQSLFVANNPMIEQGIKEIAEIQGVGNDCPYINTFDLAEAYRSKPWDRLLYERAHERIKKVVRLTTETIAVIVKRVTKKAMRILRNPSVYLHELISHTIKFVHHTGGVNGNEDGKDISGK